jgi:hypothetical protein
LFLLIIFCNTIRGIHPTINKNNAELYFDIDKVLIEESSRTQKIILAGLLQDPFNAPAYIKSLLELDKAYQVDQDGIKESLYDADGNAIEGLTFHFLHHGMRDKNLLPYVSTLITTIENSNQFIIGTRKICMYLKNKKGYPINFATNKDHIAYDRTAHTLGKKFTDIPSKVFVAHPGNSTAFLNNIKQFADQPGTPTPYRDLAYHAINIQESGNIIHAAGKKPEEKYYQCLIKNSQTKDFIVFIDDKKSNSNGFNALQNKTPIKLYGIHFTNPIQLANELIKIGILSEQDDHAFLKKIRQ